MRSCASRCLKRLPKHIGVDGTCSCCSSRRRALSCSRKVRCCLGLAGWFTELSLLTARPPCLPRALVLPQQSPLLPRDHLIEIVLLPVAAAKVQELPVDFLSNRSELEGMPEPLLCLSLALAACPRWASPLFLLLLPRTVWLPC